MIHLEEYREFFVAGAGAAGALIGLLFVAVSIFPERARQAQTQVVFHNRAAAALLVFTNALVLSLAALVPGTSVGWWAISMSAAVIVFSAATLRSIFGGGVLRSGRRGSLGVVLALSLIAGFELYAGIGLVSGNQAAMSTLCYVLIGDLLVGISRAWQLVGLRDTGLLSSLRILAGLEPAAGSDEAQNSDTRR